MQLLFIISNKKQRDNNFTDRENTGVGEDISDNKVEPKYKSKILLSLGLRLYD